MDSNAGIPFLRVQNLSPEGLDYSDCKYINQETHNSLLKRSQVMQGDLLIKITGVGRMAITSIAPEGFVGNVNQHIAVVKLKEPALGEQIATFLNSDIGEMLAARRSTGGTRPALDYTALRSIPVILNQDIPRIMKQAYIQKTEKNQEVDELYKAINSYILKEFGINRDDESKYLFDKKIFYTNLKDVIGNRFDAGYYGFVFRNNFKLIMSGRYKTISLKKLVRERIIKGILPNEHQKGGVYKVIQINNINMDGTIKIEDTITSKPIYSSKHQLKKEM